MKSKAKPRPKTASRSSSLIILTAALAYVILLVVAIRVFAQRTPTETGQLIAGQISAQSSNLDLRAAARNFYPSSSISVVQDLGSQSGVHQKIFSYQVKTDGLTEYGLEVLPNAAMPASGWPVIVLCHGYESPTHYSTTENYLADMQFYAEHGFAVLKPDYRGQGLSLHQGQADSAYYSMVYNTDVMSLISALKETKNIDKANINLWGHSMGAYIALRAAVLSPDIKNLILLSGPVDSLSKMYLTYIPPSDVNNLKALKTRNDLFDKYGTPAEDNAFWKFASPINLLGRIKAHIQIHVGALDQTVPPEFSAHLDSALSAQHINHDYYIYPDGSHSLESQRDLIWSRSLQVLKSSQPPTSAA